MNRPPARTMVMGHPVIAGPMTLAAGVTLLAGLKGDNLLVVGIAVAIVGAVQKARTEASEYRAWKAEWDAARPDGGGAPKRRAIGAGRALRWMTALLCVLAVVAAPREAAYMAGYAVGWTGRHPWLPAMLGLLVGIVVVQYVRCLPRRARSATTVAVIARPTHPPATLADAYRAVPPYAQALLGARR